MPIAKEIFECFMEWTLEIWKPECVLLTSSAKYVKYKA